MTNPKLMKVSDEEREKAVQQLSRALEAGRIDYAEFEELVERAIAARNYIELGDLVVDLPVRAPTPPRTPARCGYVPINAPSRSGETPVESSDELAHPGGGAHASVVLAVGLQAVLILAATAVAVWQVVVEVLPFASPAVGGGVVLVTAVVVLLVVLWSIATVTGVPGEGRRALRRPPERRLRSDPRGVPRAWDTVFDSSATAGLSPAYGEQVPRNASRRLAQE